MTARNTLLFLYNGFISICICIILLNLLFFVVNNKNKRLFIPYFIFSSIFVYIFMFWIYHPAFTFNLAIGLPIGILVILYVLKVTFSSPISFITRDYIFEMLGEAILILDHQFRILDFNKYFLHLFPEFSDKRILRQEIRHIFNNKDLLRHLEHLSNGVVEYNGKTYEINVGTYFVKQSNSYIHMYTFKDNTKFTEALKHLDILATVDYLTGIKNRRAFFDIANIEFKKSLRYSIPLSIIIFDLDDFKNINDIYGHSAGDEVLRVVAKIAEKELRTTDLIARYGGEEFIILLTHTAANEAQIVAERIRSCLCENNIDYNDKKLNITASFGIADTRLDLPEEDLEAIISRADSALYTVKEQGKNKVMINR